MAYKISYNQAENNLLLLCARPHVGPENITEIITTAQNGIDWYFLIRSAQNNGVLPLLYRRLY